VIIQTAFIGDAILTIPVARSIRTSWQDAFVAFVAIPSTAELLRNHDAVDEIIVYDKRRKDRGLGGFWNIVRALRQKEFDIAVVPHRSLRSALLAKLCGARKRIGFSTSTGSRLYTDIVTYEKFYHEIDRNLLLVKALGLPTSHILPDLHPSPDDRTAVDEVMNSSSVTSWVGIAPGSVWNTKRWEEIGFVTVGRACVKDGLKVVLIGGAGDKPLCSRVASAVGSGVVDLSGGLSLLQSAEVIRRCRVLLTNDSAPLHMATAMGTPVVAVFGPTIPAFGFGPVGLRDVVVETQGLSCRPCSIHGGRKCPIGTFDCMKKITPQQVYEKLISIVRNEATLKEPERNRP
jgi:heptosyltransferase-2